MIKNGNLIFEWSIGNRIEDEQNDINGIITSNEDVNNNDNVTITLVDEEPQDLNAVLDTTYEISDDTSTTLSNSEMSVQSVNSSTKIKERDDYKSPDTENYNNESPDTENPDNATTNSMDQSMETGSTDIKSIKNNDSSNNKNDFTNEQSTEVRRSARVNKGRREFLDVNFDNITYGTRTNQNSQNL